MRRLLPWFFLLLSLVPAQGESTAAPLSFSTESSADLDGTIGFGWALSRGGIHVFCAWQGRASPDCPPELPTLAVSSPWLVYGPVVGAGLLREASNPLGFSAGSAVFAERTGMRLDGSLPAGLPGLVCMPVPDVLGFYCLPSSSGVRAFGGFADLRAGPGIRAEGFLSFSKSESEDVGEDWFLSSPRDPGGAMTSGGVRLGIDIPGLSLGATVGGSFSGQAPPGSFQLLHCSWHGNEVFAEALVGRMDAAYRRPGGGCFAAGSAFSGSAGFEGPADLVKASYTVCVDQPGFAPRPSLRSSEVMGLVLEHRFAAAAGFNGACTAEAEERVRRDETGAGQEARRWSGSLTGKTGSLEAAVSAGLNEPGGFDVTLTGVFQETGRSPRLFIESRLERLGAGCPVLSVCAGLRLERKDARLSLESGMEEWTVSTAAVDAIRHFRLKVTWSTQSALGK